MAGTFYASPTEKCTRYWALSGIYAAIGILILVINDGVLRHLALIIGNNLLIAGLILKWCGIRTFYKKPVGNAGWLMGATFFVLFALFLFLGASVTSRGALASTTILIALASGFYEIWTGSGVRHSFARALTLVAIGLLLLCHAFRIFTSLLPIEGFLPTANSTLAAMVLYLIPTAGSLLLSTGLLLLYFERIVADKHYLATHDELTGMLNRRAIVAGGEREVAVAIRMQQPIAVAFVDIDHFKQ
jgi:hypothetical protein